MGTKKQTRESYRVFVGSAPSVSERPLFFHFVPREQPELTASNPSRFVTVALAAACARAAGKEAAR